jgi:epoxyqueuosine reductase
MIELLTQEMSKHGDKFKIVPVHYIEKLKQDAADLKNEEKENGFIQFLVGEYYKYELPELEFEPRSVIVAASQSPLVRVFFNHDSKRLPLMLPPAYADMDKKPAEIEGYLNDALNPEGCHVKRADSLPQKMLAVRSGLCLYGRNNITYTAAFGSFQRITTLFSDIPCQEENWYELRQMDSCEGCKACIVNCPNQAITEASFRIDARRCLTGYNEHEGRSFPDWIDPSAHHCIVGCMKCQECCPHNKKFLEHILEPVEFTAEETLYLLGGGALDDAPDELKAKVKALDMEVFYNVLPRNLNALLYRSRT